MPTAARSENLPIRSRAGSQRTSRNSTPSTNASSATTSRKRKAVPNSRLAKRRRQPTSSQNSDSDSDEEVAVEVEAPLPEDFKKEFGIPRDQYIHDAILMASIPEWPIPAPTPASENEESLDEDDVAPPPFIFSAYAGDVTPVRPRPTPKPQPRSQRRVIPKPKPKFKKASLMGMPTEVREGIYRHILVSHKPIPVYDGWKRVYERERPGLDTRILRVNKRINLEATSILYRENTFLYRLRDAPGPSHQMIGAQQLAAVDDYHPGRVSKTGKHERCTINVDKFGEDFRYLTIQADHNRHSAQTQEFMLEAIKTFAKFPSKMNVHTLQIVISPQYENGTFTFVNFFQQGSALIAALKGIACEKIVIKVWNKYLNEGEGPVRSEISLPLQYLRFAKHRKLQQLSRQSGGKEPLDLFRGDRRMQDFRMAGIRWCNWQLAELEYKVLQACRKHVQEPVDQTNGQNANDASDDDLGHDDEEAFEWFVEDETDGNSEDGGDEDSEFEPN
ncbi:uncharacterized protein NECHADRAFT_84701 [Fusarium vanettenii 77-13-4]|uniref:Uncharacterized protein n=1 Tax=Fusarium vanettenii (strain ATCC MYA-4622 / CBS 123669 / FGSC 9596 / NRRL 45880 / 77-13-4) TaxID=660122 RepID=C7YTU5_FUSV7|nr:uncharacterized protein NECHADRAFT_84701 [Fusarium vanettenii 77-13-4]EEU44307.1 hypothetical protein NECHADRAFT_84701 [Fusarium vanettenii 77-13-4]